MEEINMNLENQIDGMEHLANEENGISVRNNTSNIITRSRTRDSIGDTYMTESGYKMGSEDYQNMHLCENEGEEVKSIRRIIIMPEEISTDKQLQQVEPKLIQIKDQIKTNNKVETNLVNKVAYNKMRHNILQRSKESGTDTKYGNGKRYMVNQIIKNSQNQIKCNIKKRTLKIQ
jgi:hypothetical protein